MSQWRGVSPRYLCCQGSAGPSESKTNCRELQVDVRRHSIDNLLEPATRLANDGRDSLQDASWERWALRTPSRLVRHQFQPPTATAQ